MEQLPEKVVECLQDVVSHSNDYIKACTIAGNISCTIADQLYWKHQIDVYTRMAVQASQALERNSVVKRQLQELE